MTSVTNVAVVTRLTSRVLAWIAAPIDTGTPGKASRVLTLALFVGLIGGASATYAAGYGMDCDKARTDVEHKICSSKELVQLDRLLNQHYVSARYRSENEVPLRSEQRRWLKQVRNACGTVACLKKVYQQRIDTLAHWRFSNPYCGTQTYPPFPDVWGYYVEQRDGATVSLYELPTGEAWFSYFTGPRNERKRWIQCFFSGRRVSATSKQERGRYFAYASNHSLASRAGVVLPGGSTLRLASLPGGGARCDSGFSQYLEVRAANGVIVKRLSFLALLKSPMTRPVADCEGAPPGRRSVITYVETLVPGQAVDVGEDGVVVAGEGHSFPFAIRFDNEFNTRFHSDKVVIVDVAEIEELYQESSDYQDLADRVHQYVKETLQERV